VRIRAVADTILVMETPRHDTETTTEDTTLRMLGTIVDGSVAALANYHLLRLQLLSIRNLPERSEADRNP